MVHYLVALSLLLTPLEQSISLGASVLSSQCRQWILPLFSVTQTRMMYRQAKTFIVLVGQTHASGTVYVVMTKLKETGREFGNTN